MEEVLVAGETLVDLVPLGEGSLHDVEGFEHCPGGAPANVAVGLARLGGDPALWTRLGSDAFADYLADVLVERGITDEWVRRVDGKTLLAVVTPTGAGDRRFDFYGDWDTTFGLDPASVPTDALAARSWVHVGGVVLAHDRGRRATVELVRQAHDRGCTVSFDPNARPDLWPDPAQFQASLLELLDAVDVVSCSPADFRGTDLATDDAAALAAALLDRGPHTVVVTQGEDGAVVRSTAAAPWGATEAAIQAEEAEAVDETGAGDAFTAGLIHGLQADGDLTAAARLGATVAALTVQDAGGISALPTREDVDAFRDGD